MDKNQGARSYRGQVIGASMSITINFKWLLQIIAGTAMVVWAFWRMESRIVDLERNMVLALEEIELHEQERKAAEEIKQKFLEPYQEFWVYIKQFQVYFLKVRGFFLK